MLQVTILSTVSEEAHAAIASTSLGVDAYLEYETAVDEVSPLSEEKESSYALCIIKPG